MPYLRNQWSDFKNSWSCLVVRVLWIQRYIQCIHCTLTMQPHYRVKQLLWKYCILSGGVFYFEPPCTLTEMIGTNPWPLVVRLKQPSRSLPKESAPHWNAKKTYLYTEESMLMIIKLVHKVISPPLCAVAYPGESLNIKPPMTNVW